MQSETIERENNVDEMAEARIAADLARDGYAVARGLLSADEIALIRETFMEQAANGPVEGLSDGIYRHLDRFDPLSFYPRMMNPHGRTDLAVGPVARRFMLDRRFQTILRAAIGEEPVAAQSMFYFKPGGARGQDLHQDNFYLRVKPGTCYAAWIAVDPCDAENGGMMVVPGSQETEIVCPQKADTSISFTDAHVPVPAGLQATLVPLQAGDVLFFNGSVIHGSYPNTSTDRFRRSLIYHYVPRGSYELSASYVPLSFDGDRVAIPAATGGGPCGAPMESIRH